jgi:hypothetical protein
MQRTAIVIVLACGALASGCGLDAGGDSAQEIVDNLREVGFPDREITVVDGQVLVGGDAVVTLEASQEMLEVDPSRGGHEQYRSTNIVSPQKGFICIDGRNFTGVLSDALNFAISNYNRELLTFDMRRDFTTVQCQPGGADIVAFVEPGSGGHSGFPTNGRPFSQFSIGADVATLYNLQTVAALITHELGHAIGFRHSDWFDRSISCGPGPLGGMESADPGGAVLIPGTPSGAVRGQSVMNACVIANQETGRFSSTDRTALLAMYKCTDLSSCIHL